MPGIKVLRTEEEVREKRLDILDKFVDSLSETQVNLLTDATIRPPVKLAYNPRSRILLWGSWYIGPYGASADLEDSFIEFLSESEFEKDSET